MKSQFSASLVDGQRKQNVLLFTDGTDVESTRLIHRVDNWPQQQTGKRTPENKRQADLNKPLLT